MQIVFLLLMIAVAVIFVMQRSATSNFMDTPREQQMDQYFELQMRQWEQMHQSVRAREQRKSIEATLVFVVVLAFLMLYVK